MGPAWQAGGEAAWLSMATGQEQNEGKRERERARDGLAVVHWRHRPLSWGECGGCAPAFEALPPTNSGLPISTHCVDTPSRLALPPPPFVSLIRPGLAISSAGLYVYACLWSSCMAVTDEDE